MGFLFIHNFNIIEVTSTSSAGRRILSVSCSKSNCCFAPQLTDETFARAGENIYVGANYLLCCMTFI